MKFNEKLFLKTFKKKLMEKEKVEYGLGNIMQIKEILDVLYKQGIGEHHSSDCCSEWYKKIEGLYNKYDIAFEKPSTETQDKQYFSNGKSIDDPTDEECSNILKNGFEITFSIKQK
jgi:hypothetical protein